jgi:retinol dehydrogenase 12
VIFVSSSAHRTSPKPDGVDWNDMEFSPKASGFAALGGKYGRSKAMNVMHAHEFARRYGPQGLVSLSLHPGALKTNLQRYAPGIYNAIFALLRYPQHFGG